DRYRWRFSWLSPQGPAGYQRSLMLRVAGVDTDASGRVVRCLLPACLEQLDVRQGRFQISENFLGTVAIHLLIAADRIDYVFAAGVQQSWLGSLRPAKRQQGAPMALCHGEYIVSPGQQVIGERLTSVAAEVRAPQARDLDYFGRCFAPYHG